MRQRSFHLAVTASLLLLAGCATAPADPRDPYEPLNRNVDSVNRELDHAVLRPIARAYRSTVPDLVRTGVTNFFGNLGDVWSAANSLAQLKIGNAAQDTMRFAVNTVFGLAGVLDIASDAGMARHKEDFGTTLAHWGVPSGPYVVLPLLGPSTVRDAFAVPVDWIGDPARYVTPVPDRSALVAGHAVDARARALPLDGAVDGALDSYTFLRDAYLQRRQAQVAGSGEAEDGFEAAFDAGAEGGGREAAQAGLKPRNP